jgi:hypothetical protein
MELTNLKKEMVNEEESKIGIVVPYRNRKEHLEKFIPRISRFLKSNDIDFEIVIVEQEDTKSFNRGKLLNIGFHKAEELGCTYVAFHDVDMLPIDADYSKVDRPTHIATKFEGEMQRTLFDSYFGGVTLFPMDDFKKLNGYSNKYWGWGYEDDDLLQRYRLNFDNHDKKRVYDVVSNSVGMEFDGDFSCIEAPKDFQMNNYTIMVSCEPEEIIPNPETDLDEYAILSIPGYDTGFSYDSFRRYKFETWNYRKTLYSLKSDIDSARRIVLTATVNQDERVIKFFVDGKKVDEINYSKRLRNYDSKPYIFLGKPGSKENKRQRFKGIIDYFAFWNHSLEEEQVKAIYENLHMGLSTGFPGYEASHCLELCYDMKASTWEIIYDLSGKGRDGRVFDCHRVAVKQKQPYHDVIIPWRKEGKFYLLSHEDNGYVDNKWKHPETRKNQLRFLDKIVDGNFDEQKDGLSTLRFRINEELSEGKVHTLKVRL